MDDLISKKAAIDALRTCYDTETITMDNGDEYINYGDAVGEIEQLPPVQTDKDKVSDMLYHIYSIQSPHLDVTGVVAKKYYCEELWKELFGKESELPGWIER